MQRLVLGLSIVSLLAACDVSQPETEAPRFDHVAEPLPFARPELHAVEKFPGAAELPDTAYKKVKLRRSFFQRDFATLDEVMSQAHGHFVQGEAPEDDAHGLIDALEKTELAGIDTCSDWLEAKPNSYAAHLTCGAIWHNGAWAVRSGEFAAKVTPVRFALMRERLDRSNTLLEKAVTLTEKPVEALTLLAANRYLQGRDDAANQALQQAEALMPTYGRLHEVRLVNALPEWGESQEAVAAAFAHAKNAGVDEKWLLYYEDSFVVRPWKMSNPGAEKAYWERVIAERPTRSRHKAFAKYFHRMQNWADIVPAASRVIADDSGNAEAYWMRAEAYEKLGDIPAALSDYRAAAALGHDYASQKLIRSYIYGGLGLATKDWATLDEVCRYGAALGSSAAANCMGSISWEGGSIGGPFKTNISQAFAWHLFAARAGYHNSQYDLGWLLLTGRAPGVQPEQAQINGLFWLRRAAELDHQFAKKKLQEGGYPESEVIDETADTLSKAKELVWVILRFLL